MRVDVLKEIGIAFLEGMARRVGEELADRAIRHTQKRQTPRPKPGVVEKHPPSENSPERGA